jgi:hypothetical protein
MLRGRVRRANVNEGWDWDTFRMTVFPAAIALRTGQRAHQIGKFHGPITRMTPTGSFRIRHLLNLKATSTGTYSSFAQ